MFLHSMKFVQFHRLVKNPHQVNKMQSNHISINNVWLWFLICKLFKGSNNEFWISVFEFEYQSELVLFLFAVVIIVQTNLIGKKDLWKFVKMKFKISCHIRWTAFNEYIFPKYCTEYVPTYLTSFPLRLTKQHYVFPNKNLLKQIQSE